MILRSFALFLSAAALASAADRFTFSETIAPILYENCVTCHRPGEAAPFSLIAYDDVRKRGALIAAVTASRYMPPWHAAPGYGEFENERTLTDAQIAAIGEWVKQGMPEGDRAEMPKLPQFTEGWHLGKPDLVLEMPAAYEVPASGPDIYRNFILPARLTEDKWVRAVEFRPAARKAVHHALFAYVRSGSVAEFEGKDGKPGFSGMNGLGIGLGLQPSFQPAGGLGGWAVGGTPFFLPEQQAVLLAKGTDLILQMHFHPTGKPEMEKSVIGLYFADQAPEKRLFDLGLPFLFGIGAGLDIPAGEKNFTIRGSTTLPVDVRVLSAAAHAHYLGKEMKATATLPDGSKRPLLWIPNWDFNWQEQYNYKQPILLPKGTLIDVSVSYDNSADNPRNPSNPPKRVQWGEQSFDEMGGVGLQMVTVRKEDEAAFQQTFENGFKIAIAAALKSGTVQRYLDQQQAARKAPPPRLLRITLVDREGKSVATVGEPGSYVQAALSPEGSRVAVIRTDPETRQSDVWVYEIATGKGTPITADEAPNTSPVWSPDGKHIAYVSMIAGENAAAVYRKASDGSGPAELLYKHPPGATLVLTDWSAERGIVFWSARSTYVLRDRNAVELFHADYNVRGGRFSPDGRLLAYSTDESGHFETYIGPPDGTAARSNISHGPAAGAIFWRQDGKELYYLGSQGGQAMMAVDVNGSQVGTPRPLFKVPAGILAPAQLSSIATPDGQRFVFLVPAR